MSGSRFFKMKGKCAMKLCQMADQVRFRTMTTAELRGTFLMERLYASGELRLAYVDLDRAIAGMAAPTGQPLQLGTDAMLRAEYFTERRELGALNIGGPGQIRVGETPHSVGHLDCLYIGRGNRDVGFESTDPTNPAVFYLLSYPAHSEYPTKLIRKNEVVPVELGNHETANRRTIWKYIHLEGARSCQLVMGVTHLEAGSVWNTMPAHTHMRRSEIYMYFNLAEDARVFHLMGPPEETRHVVVKSRDAIVSPGWSIHSGVGSEAYSFCWGMGGENQDYADMDPAPLTQLL
jgi:4-deoxy-L-threo-5-hexosulose-uronate ketol-isomerase